MTRSGPAPPLHIAAVTVLGLSLALGILLVSGAVRPSSLVTPGGIGPAAEVMREDFGSDAVDPTLTGYDGQQVYAAARYFPDLDEASQHLDQPRYRLLRILPPAIVSPAPSGAPTVLALAAVNLFGIGLAVWAAVAMLHRVGVPAVGGAAACLPLLLGLATTTVGPIAWGLTLAAIELTLRSRLRLAIGLLTAAALCRESASVAALLVAAGLFVSSPRPPLRELAMFAVPGGVIAAWYLVLGELVSGEIPRRVDVFGFLHLGWEDALVPLGVFTFGVLGVLGWWDHRPVATVCAGYTGWMALYTTDILDPIALVRVNALPIALGFLAVIRLAQMRTVPTFSKHRAPEHPSGRLAAPARNYRQHI